MNFLADENLEYSIISYLREKKINILAIRDLMKGGTDAEILEYALNDNRVIITNDKDFGELTFRLQKPNMGIILLRLPNLHSEEKTNLLMTAIEKLGEDIANKFIVIEENAIRIRSMF